MATTFTKIKDHRGRMWSANYIEIHNGKPYYCGYPIHSLAVSANTKSRFYYDIILGGKTPIVNAGMIALKKESFDYLTKLLEDANTNTSTIKTPEI